MGEKDFFDWFEKKIEERFEIKRIEEQAKCEHKDVMYDATGKTGICIKCGKTIRR